MAESPAAWPSISNRVLGLAGILGGTVLLAAFAVEIEPTLNSLRLVLFNIGAIAIVIAVHRRQAAVAPALALLVAVPAVVANAGHIAVVLLATGRPQPFAGDLGVAAFVVAMAMWLTDAAFGLVALRLGVVARWGALALAVGSVLALLGIDRLGLTSPADPTIVGPLALTGVALNGIGWVLLGVDLVRGRRPVPHPASVIHSPQW